MAAKVEDLIMDVDQPEEANQPQEADQGAAKQAEQAEGLPTTDTPSGQPQGNEAIESFGGQPAAERVRSPSPAAADAQQAQPQQAVVARQSLPSPAAAAGATTTRLVVEVELLGAKSFSREVQAALRESIGRGLGLSLNNIKLNFIAFENDFNSADGGGSTSAMEGLVVTTESALPVASVKVEAADDVYNPKDVKPVTENQEASKVANLPGMDNLYEAFRTAAAMMAAPPEVVKWLCDLLQNAPKENGSAGGPKLCQPLIDVLKKFYLHEDVVRWATLLMGNWCREGTKCSEAQAALGRIEGIFGLLVPIMVHHTDNVALVRTIGFAMTGICMKEQQAILLAATPGAVKAVAEVGKKHLKDKGAIGYIGYLLQRVCEDGGASLVAGESEIVCGMILEVAWHMQQAGEPMLSAGLSLVLVEMFMFLTDEQKLTFRSPIVIQGIRYLSMLGPPLKPEIASRARSITQLLDPSAAIGPRAPAAVQPMMPGMPAMGMGVRPSTTVVTVPHPTGERGLQVPINVNVQSFPMATSSFGKNNNRNAGGTAGGRRQGDPLLKQRNFIHTLRTTKSSHDAAAVLQAMGLMHGKEERRNYLMVEDAFGVLVFALRRHLASSAVLRNGALFIAGVTSDEDVRMALLGVEGVVELLFDALIRYSSIPDVAQKILYAISQMVKEVARLAMVRDAVRTCVTVAHRNPERSIVQHASSILRRFCTPEYRHHLIPEALLIYELAVTSLQPTFCHVLFDIFDFVDVQTKMRMADPQKYARLSGVKLDVAGQEKVRHVQEVFRTLMNPGALPPTTYM